MKNGYHLPGRVRCFLVIWSRIVTVVQLNLAKLSSFLQVQLWTAHWKFFGVNVISITFWCLYGSFNLDFLRQYIKISSFIIKIFCSLMVLHARSWEVCRCCVVLVSTCASCFKLMCQDPQWIYQAVILL